MEDVCERNMCTGCGVCSVVCDVRAIQMDRDAQGFLRPSIDCELCVNCGRCRCVCPALSDWGKSVPSAVFAVWSRDRDVRLKSTSGGVFSLIASKILELGGVVYGVRLDESAQAKHTRIKTLKELGALRGSKYVQSNAWDVFEEVREDLVSGLDVLFSGTPCQVQALRNYLDDGLKKRLVTVDVVCHGVAPSDSLSRYARERFGDSCEIEAIRLRDKQNATWDYCNVTMEADGGEKVYCCPSVDDPFFCLFNFNYLLRSSCHSCRYASSERCSDLTLCDFWGYRPKSIKMLKYHEGVSCVMVNSRRGEELLDSIAPQTVAENASLDDVKRGNRCLSEPFPSPSDCDAFWQDYENGSSLSELSGKYVPARYTIPRFFALKTSLRDIYWVIKSFVSGH